MYTYPASDLNRPEKLLAMLGSFWHETYAGNHLVRSMAYARAQLDAQNHLDLLELVDSMSRLNVPVFHREDWHLLTLRESDKNRSRVNTPQYDGAYAYADPFQILYGIPFASGAVYCWDLPPDLVEIRVLSNRISAASLVWVQGTDFTVNEGTICFRADPFQSDRLVIREILEDGVVVDREVGLWLYRGAFDQEQVYTQFGYVLGCKLDSSQVYKDFVNGIFDGIVQGTTQQATQAAVAALCDVPLVREATETVEAVLVDSRWLWIVTDAHAYSFDREAVPVVVVGDVVHAGDSMVDALQFYEFNRGQVPTPEELSSLSVGRGFLAEGYWHDLAFANAVVPTTVTTADDGYTRIEWEVQGAPGDVAKFWDDIHATGVARDQTLAMLMDTRAEPAGQPSAVALPTTINPLEFLCQNIFRDNLLVVVANPGHFGPDAIGLHQANMLRKIIPPHTAFIVLTRLAITGDEITMDGPGDSQNAGYEESMKVYLGLGMAEEVDPDELIEERVVVRQIGGHCV